MNLTATKLKEAKHKTTHHLLPFIYYVTGKTTVRNIQNLGSSGGWMGRGWRSANPKRHRGKFCIKTHPAIPLRWVHFTVRKLYLNQQKKLKKTFITGLDVQF